MKKIFYNIPILLIFVPLIEIYLNSIYIIEDYEKNIFYLFCIIFVSIFLCLYLLLKILLKNQKQQTLLIVSSWTGYAFLQYRNWTKSFYYIIDGFITNINNYIFITWLLILIFGILVLIKLADKEYANVFLSIWIILSLSTPLYGYLSDSFQTEEGKTEITNNEFEYLDVNINQDIYFIMYDGLARLDTLAKFYEFEPAGLNSELIEKNFYIADDSKSSFGTTQLSLSTIFEGDYPLTDGDSYKVRNKHILDEYNLKNSGVIRKLKSQGYNILTYSNYFNCDINLDENDICLERKMTNEILYDLLISTPFQILVNNQESISFYNDLLSILKVNCQPDCGDPELIKLKMSLDNKVNVSSITKPKFYFFHMKNTHGPFYVDANCNNLKTTSYTGIAIEAKVDYVNSIKCVEKDLESFLKEIDDDAIVIIQSDHGPHYNYSRTYQDLTTEEIQNRYTIYSALRINSECKENIQSDFGQVNTFRVIFSCFSDNKLIDKKIKSFYVPINPNDDKVYDITERFSK
jgi:hypothetical protein